VLITDIQMPRMTGRELCERIQAEMPERKFLIFILTSRTEVEHREWSSRIDNVMFLEKPVSMKDLLARLDDYFAAAPAAAGA
jgi:CheY-like chemotaxis protein